MPSVDAAAAAAATFFLETAFCNGTMPRTIRGFGDDSWRGGVGRRGRAGDGTAGDDWRGTAFATSNCDASACGGSKRWAIIGDGAFDGAGDADVPIAASVTVANDGRWGDGRWGCTENARPNCKSAIRCACDWGENIGNGVAARDPTSPGIGRDDTARRTLPLAGTMS